MILLDTHALLWWFDDTTSLSQEARRVIADPESSVYVSAASIWEMTIKQNAGKLEVRSDIVALLEPQQFQPLPITLEHARVAGSLPRHHADPFDRMLVAQATAEGLTIVTRDPRIALYNVATLAA